MNRYFIPKSENSLEAIVSMELEEKPSKAVEITDENRGFRKPMFTDNSYSQLYEAITQEEIDQANKPEVPSEVPLWAMRNVLKKRNLFETIIGAINQLDEPLKSDALDFLEYGNFIERYSNAVLLIQQITQMSNDEADDLFVEANNIKL